MNLAVRKRKAPSKRKKAAPKRKAPARRRKPLSAATKATLRQKAKNKKSVTYGMLEKRQNVLDYEAFTLMVEERIKSIWQEVLTQLSKELKNGKSNDRKYVSSSRY